MGIEDKRGERKQKYGGRKNLAREIIQPLQDFIWRVVRFGFRPSRKVKGGRRGFQGEKSRGEGRWLKKKNKVAGKIVFPPEERNGPDPE